MNLGKKQFLFLGLGFLTVFLIFLLPIKNSEKGLPPEKTNSETEKSPQPSSSFALSKELEEAEMKAKSEPSAENFLSAGDLFNEQFSLSPDSVTAAGMAGKAILYYRKVLEKSPENTEAKSGLGWCIALSTAEPMKGIMLLREVVNSDPENEKAHYYLGLLSIRSGQYQKAAERFEKVLKINSENFNVFLRLAESYLAIGNKEKARETLLVLKDKTEDPRLNEEADKLLNSLK